MPLSWPIVLRSDRWPLVVWLTTLQAKRRLRNRFSVCTKTAAEAADRPVLHAPCFDLLQYVLALNDVCHRDGHHRAMNDDLQRLIV